MNREILFRGFHECVNGKETIYIDGREIKGKWVEGHNIILAERGKGRAFIVPTGEYIDDFRTQTGRLILIMPQIEVIPGTIGQYTGLTDKNGKKIFENDIIKTQPYSDRPYSAKAKSKQHVGVVYYHIRHFKNTKYQQNYEALWDVKIKDIGKYGYCDWSAFFKCEVIGNIFSNPEILRSEDK